MLWKMTVTRFGDASVLTESMWEYTCSPFFIVAYVFRLFWLSLTTQLANLASSSASVPIQVSHHRNLFISHLTNEGHVQIFLSFRIRRIARKPWNNYVFAFLVLTSTTQGILGFYLAARLLVGVTTTEGYNSYIRVASGWTGVGLACDVCITCAFRGLDAKWANLLPFSVLLIFILWSKRTGFKGDDRTSQAR